MTAVSFPAQLTVASGFLPDSVSARHRTIKSEKKCNQYPAVDIRTFSAIEDFVVFVKNCKINCNWSFFTFQLSYSHARG